MAGWLSGRRGVRLESSSEMYQRPRPEEKYRYSA